MLAQERARRAGHDYVGPEHVLSALAGEREVATVLERWDITVDDLRVDVRERVGQTAASPRGHLPFTPAAERALKMALGEALDLDQPTTSTPAHLMLGEQR